MTIGAALTWVVLFLAGQAQSGDRIVILSSAPPSEELSEFVSDSDAIALVRVKSVKPWADESKTPRPFVEYVVIVKDIVKSHLNFPAIGPGQQDLSFLEAAGEMATSRGKVSTLRTAALHPGDEAIVFLKWTEPLRHFQLNADLHGIYAIKGDEIRPAARSELSERNSRLKPADFLGLLKRTQKSGRRRKAVRSGYGWQPELSNSCPIATGKSIVEVTV
jgi:hypothetical protein